MDPNSKISNVQNTDLKIDQSNSILQNIKSNYFLERIYNNILKKKSLEIVKYNKKIQNRINLSIKDYKEYSEKFSSIEIEIIPCNNQYGQFINIKEDEKLFYHIFINDNKEEKENKYSINEEDKVTKIRIVIDYQVKSFEDLFKNCKCIQYINFKKFNRNNIDNMSYMFYECSLMEELNLSNFDSSNVIDMRFMFNKCHKLKEIKGINNFNTSKVTNMKAMFNECNELEYLDLSNFDTSSVTDMGFMFNNCHKLKEIKGINNFNTSEVTNMSAMFQECYELEYLNLSNFNTHNVTDMEAMFNNCHKLKEIKGINNFDLTNVKNKNNIFNGCNNLNQIILSKFNVTITNNNEKYIYVIFNTIDWSIKCFAPCYTSENFTAIEEKLYNKYPELKNKQIYYTVNGITINRSDTLEKNNIKSNTNILINYY